MKNAQNFSSKKFIKKKYIEKLEGESSIEGKPNKAKAFYEELFSEKRMDVDLKDHFIKELDKEFTEEEKLSLDVDVSEEELFRTVNSWSRWISYGVL